MRHAQFYTAAPIFALLLARGTFILLPSLYKGIIAGYRIVIFICLSARRVFVLLYSGWSSNSKYTLIGALRGVAQSISYEAVFRTIILLLISILGSYSIESLATKRSLLGVILFPLWLICLLGETHRAPFDFAEAESELVSGFNTEYRGPLFAYLFLGEYVILLFGCMLMRILFVCGPLEITNYYIICLIALGFTFVTIWIRVTFCRYRYDMLINTAWKVLLPIRLRIFLILFWII